MPRPRSLHAALLWRLVLVTVVPVALAGAVSWHLAVTWATENVESHNQHRLEGLLGETETFLEIPVALLHQLQGVFVTFSGHDDRIKDERLVLEAAVRDSGLFESILILDRDGRVVNAGRPRAASPGADALLGTDLSHRPTFREAKATGRAAWSDTFVSSVTGETILTLTLPFGEDRFVSADFGFSRLTRQVSAFSVDTGMTVAVLDRKGRVIFHSNPDFAENPTQLDDLFPVKEALAGRTGRYRYREGEHRCVGSTAALPGVGWIVLVAQPTRLAFEPVRHIQWLFACAIGLAIVLSLWASVRHSNWVLAPFDAIHALAQAFAAGRYDIEIPPQRYRETQDLVLKLQSMAVAIRDREAQLREREEKYRLLAENAADVIWTMDLEGNLTYVSPSVETLRGYSAEETMQQPLAQRVCPESLDTVVRHLGEPGDGSTRGFEIEQPCRDGSTVWVEVQARPVLDDQGSRVGVLGVTRNITERRRIEAQRSALEAQLVQARKMEAIGTLAGGIAHDFNNILAAIFGYTELAHRLQPEGAQARDYLDAVLEAAYRARDLVRQILTFSRRNTARPYPLDPAPVVKETLKLLRASLPSTIEIRSELNTGRVRVMVDPTQIHQILMNLCTNAYHAMRTTGGLLTVALSAVEVDGALAASRTDLRVGEYVRLQVADTGSGIPPEEVDRIFEPFYTTKEVGEGTGLGLAVVHGIALGCDGAVTVESEPGKGSRFTVYLPRHGEEGAEDRPESAREEAPEGIERVLFADDEPALVRLGERLLGSLGYHVTAVSSGEAAWACFESDPHGFDLLVTDQTMPRLTGTDLARKVWEVRPDLPVVVCTGFSDLLDAERAEALGFRGFLFKPLERIQLAHAVRAALDGPAVEGR